MITEEKAKAYDEAIEKARKRVATEPQDHTDAILKDIFPELRESEDERIRKEIIELLKEVGQDDTGVSENVKCMLAWLEKQKEQKPELVQHPPITYTYPSDASRDEQLKRAIIALLNSDLIKVAGKKFTKQDLIDWVEKQNEQKCKYQNGFVSSDGSFYPVWSEEQQGVEGVVHHASSCHWIVTDQEALNARLRGIPEGTVVNIFICKAEEEQK